MTNIRTLRTAAGLTQAQLASRAGITRRTLWKWEKMEREDKRHEFLVIISMLADALNCDMADILKDELEP